ncbi:hypothetical protein QYF36_017305 [Acer negundo]|nr:hypothetical protein QYF36_017305 [Acer negundo]
MAKELEELKKGKHKGIRKNLLDEMNAPFSKRIRDAGLLPKFRMSSEKYSGTEDPISHLESFVHQMKGIKPYPKDPILLQYVIQERGETLRSYVEKFHKEVIQMGVFRNLGQFPKKLVDIKEQLRIKVEHDEARLAPHPMKKAPKPVLVKRFQNQPLNRAALLKEVARMVREEDVYNHYTPFNASRETIYLAIRDKCLFRKLGPMRGTITSIAISTRTSDITPQNATASVIRSNDWKNHARKIPKLNTGHEIFKVSSGSRDPSRFTKIVFTEEDVYNTVQPHDYPMLHLAFVWFHKGLCNAHGIKNPTGDSRRSYTLAKRDDGVYRGGYPICLQCHSGFSLPKIDQLIDSTVGNKFLSFMDAFSGYNQIMMHPSDQDKTNFITGQDLYCYKVMPFGLKNAGAIYQRMVNKLFKQQIGRSMEVYIDDMIKKSLESGQHTEDLRQTFQVIRKNQMRPNPTKSAFGVAAGKFLGFMVHERGIEANPEMIKAILDLKSPATLKQAQGLTGRIVALN